MDDILKTMRDAGFQPTPNTDEQFPAIKGEYRVEVMALKPWLDKESKAQEAYELKLRINETLSGDKADGRQFTKFYRVAGVTKEWVDGKQTQRPTNQADAGKAIMAMANDVATLEGDVRLDLASIEAMEASMPGIVGRYGYLRAWHFSPAGEDRQIQQWVLKQARHLKKESQAGAGAEAPPF